MISALGASFPIHNKKLPDPSMCTCCFRSLFPATHHLLADGHDHFANTSQPEIPPPEKPSLKVEYIP